MSIEEERPPLDLLIVDSKLEKSLRCSICLQVLEVPKQCLNGHLFCCKCIMKYLNTSQTCPQCRIELKKDSLSRNMFVEETIRNLNVWCKYRFKWNGTFWEEDPMGCYEILSNEEALNHEKICPRGFVSCPFSKECKHIRREELEDHKTNCIFGPEECQYCGVSMQKKMINTHLNECEHFPCTCKWCHQEYKRFEEAVHMRDVCLSKPKPCPYSKFGCSVPWMNKETLEKHIIDNNDAHLLTMSDYFDNKLTNLQSRYQKKLEDLEKKFSNSASVSETLVKWKLYWPDNYNLFFIASKPFMFSGYKWYLGMFPKGEKNNMDSSGWASIFLYMDKDSIKNSIDGKSVLKKLNISFKLSLVNLLFSSKTIEMDFDTTFPIKGGEGWGDKIIETKEISNSGYLTPEGYIFIECRLVLNGTVVNI